VLVRGESGSGKELIARALHTSSPRAERPFVTLNCAAIPETMLESELFGYEKGAFTGAVAKKRGKFALADGGTLFLDEIGDLALPAQAKLLRAIQEGEIQPLGAERTQKVDVRVVSATHKDLMKEIADKRFREDLYYRLAVVEIEVPPLREREGDVALLATALMRRSAAQMGKRLDGFTDAALAALVRHDWPGNVRELRNEIERAVINADGALVDAHDLSPRLGAARPKPGQPRTRSLAEQFAELEPTEKSLVEDAMSQAKGNVSEAARLLGITRIMMKRRVDKLLGGGKDED
jgi:Nif-specific regulatory protein